ncbi:MAG: ASKHA domain-containing protein [Anaerolineaceae bacterium]|nr:ASKHA domain-containing protein [Anaerolineaceae bacterium]
MEKYKIDLEPIGSRTEITGEQTLLHAAQQAGVHLAAVCGGAGVCGKCRVRIITGQVSPPNVAERRFLTQQEIEEGYRLACMVTPLSDVKLHVPPGSLTTTQRLQVEGQETKVTLQPSVIGLDLEMEVPSLEDLRSDQVRVQDASRAAGHPHLSTGLPVLSCLSDRVRNLDWKFRLVLRDDEVVAVLPEAESFCGLAVDIGTTKIAAYLVNLETGETIAKTGAMNPQVAYGEDVVSRIAYVNEGPDQKRVMQQVLVDTLNEVVASLCEESGLRQEQIVDAVMVGNTAIHHLFLGLPVMQLGMSPFIPAVSQAVQVPAAELGLQIAPGANIYLPPNIAGYVGADHVSVQLVTRLLDEKRTVIACDIGTNTEISIIHQGQVWSCSCASGPAFEGAHISAGMRAAPGAIERVKILDDGLHINTIEDQPPVGICGSGILDAISEMLSAGMLKSSGALDRDHPMVRKEARKGDVLLAAADTTGHKLEIVVTRSDINEIQLAKGAIRAGIDVLMETAGVGNEEVDAFILAGAFGTYIDVDSGINIGMFPPLARHKFSQVGNAAGIGAKQMLVSTGMRAMAEAIARKVDYIELTTYPRFTHKFAKAMFFPETTGIGDK